MTTLIPDRIVSVEGLTTYLLELFESDRQLQQIWVTGEVSSVHNHPVGLFFTLSDTKAKAAIQCVVWSNSLSKLLHQPEKGDEVLVLANLGIYGDRSQYQLKVFQVLATGEGLKALRYQQLKSRLQAEGLFDPQRKRQLPPFPKTIAVVTSPTAAAWGDIKKTLLQRSPGLKILFSAATVQGEDAPESIAKAIERVNRDKRAEVLVLARGGGAQEDLSCFNDEIVVRAIALSKIPVITGLGHQRDESLADLVADVSAHTPTAAAQLVTPDYIQLHKEHEYRTRALLEALRRRLDQELSHLETLSERFAKLPQTSRRILQASATNQLLKGKLIALDPQAVLTRGYAIAKLPDNTLLRSTQDVVYGQEILIRLGEGTLKVKITEIIS